MKNSLSLSLFVLLSPVLAYSQQKAGANLYQSLRQASSDSAKYRIQQQLVDFYIETNRDSALYFVDRCLNLAQKNDKSLDEASALSNKGHALMHVSRFSEAYICLNQALKIAGQPANNAKTWNRQALVQPEKYRLKVQAEIYLDFANMMGSVGNAEKKLDYLEAGQRIATQNKDTVNVAFIQLELAPIYTDQGKLDSALAMEQNTLRVLAKAGINRPLGYAMMMIGLIYQKKNQDSLALHYYYRAIRSSTRFRNFINLKACFYSLTQFYLYRQTNPDSAIYYARKNLNLLKLMKSSDFSGPYTDLAKGFGLSAQKDSVLKYQSLALAEKDSAYRERVSVLNNLQKLSIEEQEKMRQFERRTIENRDRLRIIFALSILVVTLVVTVVLYRTNVYQRQTNDSLQKALADLKITQAQLIQKEKLASLGELTAGIAHEIQNPLNFVNNFAEVSAELIEELKAEAQAGHTEDVLAIADDLNTNLRKITHHGGRASNIVKGMLEHARTDTGPKRATDLNTLADEYLRIAYHGLKAKDKTVNCELITHFDPTLEPVEVAPQEIGRVLLNLYNNAFYAVSERAKQRNEVDYKPRVEVRTQWQSGRIVIQVRDNGTGIPDSLKTRIFQPFFTTRPAGEGIGLGLSLSYDIITKGHQGTLDVTSQEGRGTEFIIQLPVEKKSGNHS